jgi:hypothetical protein
MKTISIFLALVNSLLAGLMLASAFSPAGISRAAAGWAFLKIVTASLVILVGVLTFLGSAHENHSGLIAVCSLFLTALGAAIIVWTFHLELVSGDLEYHLIVYGGSLIVQGMASLFGFVGNPGSIISM